MIVSAAALCASPTPQASTSASISLSQQFCSAGRGQRAGRQWRPARRPLAVAAAGERTQYELRICTNRTCKSQGSLQLVTLGKDLGLEPDVTVVASGCQGACGHGPNIAVIPLDGTTPMVLHHVGTVAKFSQVLREVCSAPVDDTLLRATELRLAGNAAARSAELGQAIKLYTQALELNPPAGRHLLLSNRSGARLAAGDFEGALQDANAAAEIAPPEFTTAAVRQAEALLSLGRLEQAMACLQDVCDRGRPEFARSDAYKALTRHAKFLQQQGKVKAKA